MEVEELKILAEKVKIAREEYDKASKAQKEASELKSLLESKMLDALEETDLLRFDVHDAMFIVINKTSAKTPKTPEDREKFFDYLREQGVYEDMITVNSNTLNSYVKTEEALATERGELDFSIPGIAIDYYKQLSVRKK
jgi:hypothetical protein